MRNYRRSAKYGAVLAAVLLLTGCSEEAGNAVQQETVQEEDAWEQGAEEDDEKGYGLPVDEEEREEAEQECAAALELTKEFARAAQDAGGVLTEDEAEQMADVLAAQGNPVTTFDIYQDMKNCEVMDAFLEDCENGRSAEAAEYEVYKDGSIGRKKFVFDGEDLYVLSVTASWRGGDAKSIGEMACTRAEKWDYTEKGWFFYKLCTPGYPEVTEVLYSNAMLRVKPYDAECAEISRTCLSSIAYEGNNLFWSDWGPDNMAGIDYNGLFQYLYELDSGEAFDSSLYTEGIPAEQFESMMTKYLPVSAEQLREYASYDAESGTYAWIALGVGNRTKSVIDLSEPEVVDIEENGDGTVTLTVDAVSEGMMDDAVLTHRLTVRFADGGGVEFLENQVEGNALEKMPEYVYRIQES